MRLLSNISTRLGLLLARLLGHLPLALSRRLLRPLSPLMRLTMGRRRRIVERNLELCFPDWPRQRRTEVTQAHFSQLAEAIAEIAFCWCHRGRLDRRYGEVVGLEHLEAARRSACGNNRGVLLVTGHVTCLELAARLFAETASALFAESVDVRGIYRPLRNPVLNAFQNTGRNRYNPGMIERTNVRGMVRHLRAGDVLWYAPDQDFGPDRSEFAPFFGIPTATARGLLDLARLGNAAVVPMFPTKDESTGRITVTILPAFDNFPGADPIADLTRFNAFLEHHIRQAPNQYWWLHRRFKTAPPNHPPRYPGK